MEDEIVEGIVDDPEIRSVSFLDAPIDKSVLTPAGTTTRIVKLRKATHKIFQTEKNPSAEKYILVTDLGDAYLNWTSFKALKAEFGQTGREWRGKRVTVKKVVQMVNGKERDVLYFTPA